MRTCGSVPSDLDYLGRGSRGKYFEEELRRTSEDLPFSNVLEPFALMTLRVRSPSRSCSMQRALVAGASARFIGGNVGTRQT